MEYFKMAGHGGRFEDLPSDVTRGIYSNTRMKIGCVYSTLIEVHLRIIDLIKKSKTSEVIRGGSSSVFLGGCR